MLGLSRLVVSIFREGEDIYVEAIVLTPEGVAGLTSKIGGTYVKMRRSLVSSDKMMSFSSYLYLVTFSKASKERMSFSELQSSSCSLDLNSALKNPL